MLKSTFMGYNAVADNTSLYLHSFSSCCLPNTHKPAKFSENSDWSSSRSSKVIHLGVNREHICDLLPISH